MTGFVETGHRHAMDLVRNLFPQVFRDPLGDRAHDVTLAEHQERAGEVEYQQREQYAGYTCEIYSRSTSQTTGDSFEDGGCGISQDFGTEYREYRSSEREQDDRDYGKTIGSQAFSQSFRSAGEVLRFLGGHAQAVSSSRAPHGTIPFIRHSDPSPLVKAGFWQFVDTLHKFPSMKHGYLAPPIVPHPLPESCRLAVCC